MSCRIPVPLQSTGPTQSFRPLPLQSLLSVKEFGVQALRTRGVYAASSATEPATGEKQTLFTKLGGAPALKAAVVTPVIGLVAVLPTSA